MTGNNPPPAVSTFKDMNLRDLLLENLKKCNYVKPTPIQCNASPVLLAKRDIMACAQTGSGKTAGFLLPILNTLLAQNDLTPAYTSPVTPEALIIAPTRELACQIGKEAHMYSHGSIIKTRITYGGTAIFAQKNQLMNGCNILVATPGRLKQFVTDGIVSLAKVQFFILDEADRMLDMGFMPDVQAIVEKLPEKTARVSGMFSATFPDPIQRAAEAFLNDHIFVAIGVVGGACQEVQQTFIECERNDKRSKLMEILESVGPDEKVLVFCASKKGADFLATFLSSKNVSSTSIHGDRLQRQREEALREFTNGTRKILVATAVAARGLDIPKVAVVVNYDLPSEIDEYVHRIGRTGRVGHSGKAISFYDANQDSQMLSPLVAILEGAGQTVPDFMKGGSYGGGSFGNGDSFGFASTDSRGGGGGAAPAAAAKKDEDDDW
jgi:probable ATP-dependent RNA helicase DDX4